MDYHFENRPSYTTGIATLNKGESITLEAGAMLSHSEHIDIDTQKSSGGFISSIKNSILTNESMYRNIFTATEDDQKVRFAQNKPGDMMALDLNEDTYYIQSGSYIANSTGVETDSESGDLDSLLGGKGLFFLKASGSGHVFVGSYGGIVKKELSAGEKFVIDSSHTVAWSDIEYKTRKVGGLKQSILSDEGFVMEFTGPGEVFIQTRDYDAFVNDIASKINTGN